MGLYLAIARASKILKETWNGAWYIQTALTIPLQIWQIWGSTGFS